MKNLKTSIITNVVLAISILFYSCSDDDKIISPIRLKDKITTINLTYSFSSDEADYYHLIEGGDGNYSVESDNNTIVSAEYLAPIKSLSLKVYGLGETTVTITDQSSNKLILTVVVDYRKECRVVKKHDIHIWGDDLTENEKKTISEEYLAQIPVKVGGGYDFIYNNVSNLKGKAIIYTDNYGNKGKETIFDIVKVSIPDGASMQGYEININGEKRTFIIGKYTPLTKAIAPVTVALMEDITKKVQIDYPKVEMVYTSQVIEVPRSR